MRSNKIRRPDSKNRFLDPVSQNKYTSTRKRSSIDGGSNSQLITDHIVSEPSPVRNQHMEREL